MRSSASYEIRPETSAKNDEPPMHATMNVAKMSPNGGVVSAPAEKAGVLSAREAWGAASGECVEVRGELRAELRRIARAAARTS